MTRGSTLLVAVVLTATSGCKSKLQEEVMDDSTWETSTGTEEKWKEVEPPSKPDDQRQEEGEPTEGAPTPSESKPESLLQSYPRVSSGRISRKELSSVLDRGLGRFLQNVETTPAFHKGAFVGFRLVSLFPGEPAFASLDLRPGDTVTAVNGRPIERPEQAAAVWEDLRTASNLVVEYLRGEQRRALHFAIVDAP